jgi:hypothetical protein
MKKIKKKFKLPFKSTSPKIKHVNTNNLNHKSSAIYLKKASKIKSPYKGFTETGPVIKRVLSNFHDKIKMEKHSIFTESKEDKKITFNNKLKSPNKKTSNHR